MSYSKENNNVRKSIKVPKCKLETLVKKQMQLHLDRIQDLSSRLNMAEFENKRMRKRFASLSQEFTKLVLTVNHDKVIGVHQVDAFLSPKTDDEKVFVKDEDNQVVSSVTSSSIDQSDTGLSLLSKGSLELEEDSSASALFNSNVDKQSAANPRNLSPKQGFRNSLRCPVSLRKVAAREGKVAISWNKVENRSSSRKISQIHSYELYQANPLNMWQLTEVFKPMELPIAAIAVRLSSSKQQQGYQLRLKVVFDDGRFVFSNIVSFKA